MIIAALILAILVLVGLAIQLVQSLYLVRLFRNYQPISLPDNALPSCAVVLCLRGCDPGLKQHVESLLDQDYPDFHVVFVFDHAEDSALQVVRDLIEERTISEATFPKASIRIVEPNGHSSLLANHHGTVLPELAKNYEVLALVDADAATWPTWLRTLVTPLVNSDLSMVYGNRWYMPQIPTFAAICRFVWNYGSVQQMVFFRYPWGGSLAMKAELALLSQFGESLKKSFGNDTPMISLADSAGMKTAYHPGIMLINQEQVRFDDFYNWIGRQMVYGRLYHPTWPIVLGTGVATALVVGTSMLLNLICLVTMDWLALWILVSVLFLFWIVWVGLLFHFDGIIGRMVSSRGEPRRWWSPVTAIRIFLIAPCVQFVFLAGLFRASRMKRVRWRGVDYQIDGPFDVRITNYQPWLAETTGDESIQ